jgi:hypothetical protein
MSIADAAGELEATVRSKATPMPAAAYLDAMEEHCIRSSFSREIARSGYGRGLSASSAPMAWRRIPSSLNAIGGDAYLI